jgi:hypothetical protein
MGFTCANLCEALFGRSMGAKELARLYGVVEEEVASFYEALEAKGLAVLKDPATPRWERAAGTPATVEAFMALATERGLDLTVLLTAHISVTGVRVKPEAQRPKKGRRGG